MKNLVIKLRNSDYLPLLLAAVILIVLAFVYMQQDKVPLTESQKLHLILQDLEQESSNIRSIISIEKAAGENHHGN